MAHYILKELKHKAVGDAMLQALKDISKENYNNNRNLENYNMNIIERHIKMHPKKVSELLPYIEIIRL